MVKYSTIQQILDEAIGGEEIGAHQAFWRGLDRDAFVSFLVFGEDPTAGEATGRYLRCRGIQSATKALEGRFPFGKDIGTPRGKLYRRMPARRPAVAPKKSQRSKTGYVRVVRHNQGCWVPWVQKRARWPLAARVWAAGRFRCEGVSVGPRRSYSADDGVASTTCAAGGADAR